VSKEEEVRDMLWKVIRGYVRNPWTIFNKNLADIKITHVQRWSGKEPSFGENYKLWSAQSVSAGINSYGFYLGTFDGLLLVLRHNNIAFRDLFREEYREVAETVLQEMLMASV